MRETGTSNNRTPRSCKRNQSQTVVVGDVVETVHAYSSLVDVFLAHLRIEIPQKQLYVIRWNGGIRFIKLFVKEVFHFFVGIFGGCMSANYADVVKFAF